MSNEVGNDHMTNKLIRSLRLEPVLSARCDAKAAESQTTFSEWVRDILRREVGLTRQRGSKRGTR